MEKEKLTPAAILRFLATKLPVSILLAVPLTGMLVTSSEVLAEVELGDPVELYKTHALPMSFFRWCVICGIILAFTPFKRLCAMAAGLAVGSLVFYGLDLHQQLEELSKMGLSSKPLSEMVVLSSSGKWLVGWCAAAIGVQVLAGLVFPCVTLRACCKSRCQIPSSS